MSARRKSCWWSRRGPSPAVARSWRISPPLSPGRGSVPSSLALSIFRPRPRAPRARAPRWPPMSFGEVAASDVKACVEPSRLANVAILRLGRLIPSSGQLLARAPAILDASRQLADVVIVEAPPLLVFHDGEALTSVADVVVLVGECGFTGHVQAQRAGELLKRISAPVLGVALTEVAGDGRGSQAGKGDTGGEGRSVRLLGWLCRRTQGPLHRGPSCGEPLHASHAEGSGRPRNGSGGGHLYVSRMQIETRRFCLGRPVEMRPRGTPSASTG